MPALAETNSVQGATWDTKFIDSLPNSSFAYVNGDVRKLPYKDANGKVDLPHVRNALARLNQTQGIPDDEKPKIKTKLQNALNNPKAAADMVFRSLSQEIKADATTGDLPDRVHLLREGVFNTQKYGEVPVTADDIVNMPKNFEMGVGMPNDGPTTGIPADFSHKSGEKAGAWIHGLEAVKAEDGLYDLWGTKLEWTKAGREEVGGGNFKYISADFYPAAFGEWVDPESGVVATSVMVGAGFTNRPMFTGNRAVMASEVEEAEATGVKTVIYVNANESKNKENSMSHNIDELRVKAADDLTGPEALFIAQNVDKLSEDERKKFGFEAAVDDTKKKEEEEAEAKKAADLKASQEAAGGIQAAAALKAAQDEIEALKASVDQLSGSQKASEHDKIQQEVEAYAAEGKIKPDQIETFVTALEADDKKTVEAVRSSLKAMAANPLIGKKYGSSKTAGSAELDNAEEEIMKKATELVAAAHAKGGKLNIFEARKQVLASSPELDQKVTGAVQASVSFDPFQGAWGTNAAGLQGVNPEALKR